MSFERAIVESLHRNELLALADYFELDVPDRRKRAGLVSALTSARRARLDAILARLPLVSLKQVCRDHGLDDSGRQKAQLVDRLLAQAAKSGRKASKKSSTAKTAKKAASGAATTKKRGKRAPKATPKKAARSSAPVAVQALDMPPAAGASVAPPPPVAAAQIDQVPAAAQASAAITMTAESVRAALQAPPNALPRPLMPEPTTFLAARTTQKCRACHKPVELRKCGVQRCSAMMQANPSRKICAECLFERNTLSMVEFNARLEDEAKCPHCGGHWQQMS